VSEIDWNVEFRKVLRDLDGLPPEPTRTPTPPRQIAKTPPERIRTQVREQPVRRSAPTEPVGDRLYAFGIWARLILVAGLGVGLFWWPYGHGCGYALAGYLTSNAIVVIGGALLALRTWEDRMPWAFLGSALCVGVAWTVLALHTLPRLGYSPAGGPAIAWSCPVSR